MTRWLKACVLMAYCACGADTEGESIAIRWSVEAADRDDSDREFVTDTGWHVQLDEARVAIETILALAPEADGTRAIARLSHWLVPVAHAHGGHDEATGRRIRAEWLDAFVVDALADESNELGVYGAEAGTVDTLKLALARTKTDVGETLDGFRAYVAGTAERDGERVSFTGGLTFAEDEPARRVETPVRFELSEGGTLVLDVHASEWLRAADFGRLSEGEPGAPREITAQTQVGRAWGIGIRRPTAFGVRWKPARK